MKWLQEYHIARKLRMRKKKKKKGSMATHENGAVLYQDYGIGNGLFSTTSKIDTKKYPAKKELI
jgi:hypothetical protein